MSNHVHLVVIPQKADGLALSLKHTHGRYASYWNAVHHSSGHAWQGRYYSCPLDQPHLWEALRYTELNPIRARLVTEAQCWAWSSAATHCGAMAEDNFLDMGIWQDYWTAGEWRAYLASGGAESEIAAIRQCTHTGRPLGTQEFIHALEESTQRRLVPQKGGRPEKTRPDGRQSELHFG
jgi:putative transposase